MERISLQNNWTEWKCGGKGERNRMEGISIQIIEWNGNGRPGGGQVRIGRLCMGAGMRNRRVDRIGPAGGAEQAPPGIKK
jgi:hypothetical protein